MYMIAEVSQYVAVASFAEAWIEIQMHRLLPMENAVASFAEAWIEMHNYTPNTYLNTVASFAEAWIEMCEWRKSVDYWKSPPSRRRGLKLQVEGVDRTEGSRLLRGGVD